MASIQSVQVVVPRPNPPVGTTIDLITLPVPSSQPACSEYLTSNVMVRGAVNPVNLAEGQFVISDADEAR